MLYFDYEVEGLPKSISIQDFCIRNKTYLTIFFRNGTRTALNSVLSDDKNVSTGVSMKSATSIELIAGVVLLLF